MISKELLDILICPENHMPLSLADGPLVQRLNQATADGRLKNASGAAVENKLDGALVREDGQVLYPIVDGIPILLVEEAISLDQLGDA